MARMYVLGNTDAVLGFSLIGIEGYTPSDPSSAAARLAELDRSGHVGLVLITEDIAEHLRAQIGELLLKPDGPLILEVPAPGSMPRPGKLSEALKRAIGVPL